MTFKDYGIVLRESFVGESDKILTILMRKHGKISVSAKGARNTKSKFAASTTAFCYSEFVIFAGNGFLSLCSGEIINNFYAIRNDFDALCYSSFFLEIADKMLLPEMPSNIAIDLLVKALSVMSKGKIDKKLIFAVFQLKFMQLEGFSPTVKDCSICSKKIIEPLRFNGFGVVCSNCSEKNDLEISETTQFAINYILNSGLEKLFSFSLSETALSQLVRATNLFRKSQLDINFKSLELLE